MATEDSLPLLTTKDRKRSIFDCDATHHNVVNRSSFVTYESLVGHKIGLGKKDAFAIPAGRGTAQLWVRVNGVKQCVELTNASHISDGRVNLLSIGCLMQHGVKVHFSENGAQAIDSGTVVMENSPKTGLFKICELDEVTTTVSMVTTAGSVELWHARMAPVGLGLQFERQSDLLTE